MSETPISVVTKTQLVSPIRKLTLPLGTGVSKTVILGRIPVKFSLQYWYYVVSSDAFGPEHQIRFQVAPVVPLPW